MSCWSWSNARKRASQSRWAAFWTRSPTLRHRFPQRCRKVGLRVQKAAHLLCDARFLALLQLQQDMLLGGGMQEEGAVGDSSGGHDGADIGLGDAGSFEFGNGRAH